MSIETDTLINRDPLPSRIGTNANYSEFEADGTLVMTGSATVWDDLRVPLTSTRLGGSKDPDFVVYKEAAGSSQGVFAFRFDAATEEELYFACQVPHSYKHNTNLHPHVHWMPIAAGSATEKVSWGLEYTWADIGQVYPSPCLIYGNVHTPADSALTQDKHYLTEIGEIAMSSSNVSAMLICRVFRDATSTGCDDTYDSDAGLVEIDFHYEMDTLGSRTEYTK